MRELKVLMHRFAAAKRTTIPSDDTPPLRVDRLQSATAAYHYAQEARCHPDSKVVLCRGEARRYPPPEWAPNDRHWEATTPSVLCRGNGATRAAHRHPEREDRRNRGRRSIRGEHEAARRHRRWRNGRLNHLALIRAPTDVFAMATGAHHLGRSRASREIKDTGARSGDS